MGCGALFSPAKFDALAPTLLILASKSGRMAAQYGNCVAHQRRAANPKCYRDVAVWAHSRQCNDSTAVRCRQIIVLRGSEHLHFQNSWQTVVNSVASVGQSQATHWEVVCRDTIGAQLCVGSTWLAGVA